MVHQPIHRCDRHCIFREDLVPGRERRVGGGEMSGFDPAALAQFTGTERYFRRNRLCLLTDCTKYLAQTAGSYWPIHPAASYVIELGATDWFVLVRLVALYGAAVLTLEHSNRGVGTRQAIPFTDFPLTQQVLYAF